MNQRIIKAAEFPEGVADNMVAAMTLLLTMKALSFEVFNTPWAPHLDKILWREMQAPKRITAMDASSLRWLNKVSGGWWSWNDPHSKGPTFVTSSQWRSVVIAEATG